MFTRYLSYNILLIIFIFLSNDSTVSAQHLNQNGQEHEISPLFKEDKLFKIHLSYSKLDILTNSNDSTYIESKLSYELDDGSLDSIDISMRARGNYRKLNCYYLPLTLKIKKKASQGTIFQEDKKLKIVLPCLNSNRSNDHIVKEYIAYKLFELISPYHFETKLLSVQLNETKSNKTIDHNLLGIFIQDDKKTASVNDGKRIKRKIHPNMQDPLSSARNAMFQFMIGNTDYSIAYQHNEKLFYIDDKIVPIPYDFDMSGLVNTSYAVVSAIKNKTLPITRVTQRLYRGFDRDDQILEEVRSDFLKKEVSVYALIDTYEKYFRDTKEFTRCKRYIESFYDIIKDDKKFQRNIIKKERTELD